LNLTPQHPKTRKPENPKTPKPQNPRTPKAQNPKTPKPQNPKTPGSKSPFQNYFDASYFFLIIEKILKKNLSVLD